MEVLEQFDTYLTEWAHKKHVPKPSKNTNKEMWGLAWNDFVNEVLAPNYAKINNQYKDMELLTHGERVRRNIQQYNNGEEPSSSGGVAIPELDPIDLEAENIDYNELINSIEEDSTEEAMQEDFSNDIEKTSSESDWDLVQQYLNELE